MSCAIKRKAVLLLLLILCALLSGCGKAAKGEKAIIQDLQEHPFFVNRTSLDAKINDYEVIKRQTDKNNKSDVIYLSINASNDVALWECGCVMTYGLYDEGWILDDVQLYNEMPWVVTPRQGVSDAVLQAYFDSLKRSQGYSSVEIVGRDTSLEPNTGYDEVTYEVTMDHLYATEKRKYIQTWFFNEYSCDYYASGEPFMENRSVMLKETIVGAGWTNMARYYGTYDIFSDQFDIYIVALSEDKIQLVVQGRDIWAAHWNGLDDPPGESTVGDHPSILSYFEDTNDVGISLRRLGLVGFFYDDNDDDRFTVNDYFIFSLDQPGSGKIQQKYGNVIEKNAVSGKSTEDEVTDYVISLAQNAGISSYDPKNPMCGIWKWNSDDADFENTIWCIYPNGTFSAYVTDNADGYFPLFESLWNGYWKYNGTQLSINTVTVDYETEPESFNITWHGNNTFELVTGYSAYYFANRVHY